jgi:hypothetical protein
LEVSALPAHIVNINLDLDGSLQFSLPSSGCQTTFPQLANAEVLDVM